MKEFQRGEGVNDQKQGLANRIGMKIHLIHWAMESQKVLIAQQFSRVVHGASHL